VPPPSQPPLLASTWAELRRRKVVRVAIAYALVAWVVLQLGEITFEPLGLPPRALTWTILAAILGFPVALVLAWVFDHGDDGLALDRAGGVRHGPVRLFALALVLLTVAALAWWLSDVYRDDDDPTPEAPAATAAAGAGDAVTDAQASAAPPNSIAVLPFDDMSAEGDQAWFADGLAEELLDRLARVDGLRVAARTSSFALRGSALDVAAIGQALNVGMVLEGSVRKAEGRIRVTAQLIDVGTGYHLWTQTYERADQGIFELQDEITADIVDNLRQRLPGLRQDRPGPAQLAVTAGSGTRDLRAHELYLQGRVHWRQRTPAALARAADLFEQALALDPDFARAWSGLADSRLLLADYGGLRAADAVAQAEPAVVRALDLAPGLGEAWASLGLLRMTAGQLEAAEGNLLEAIRLDPHYDMALMWLGGLYGQQGRLQARLEILERAHALSPLDPAINVNLASMRSARGDHAGAVAMLEDLLKVTPDSNIVRRSLADFLRVVGEPARALEQADRAWRQEPEAPASIVSLAMSLAALRRFDEAQRLVDRLPEQAPDRAALTLLLALQRDRSAPVPAILEPIVERVLDSDGPVLPEDRPLLQLTALSDYWNGRRDRALRTLEKLVETRPGASLLPEQLDFAQSLMMALRESGRLDEAKALEVRALQSFEQLQAQGLGGSSVQFGLAVVAVIDGDLEGAVRQLGEAVDAGFSELWVLDADPRLRPLHGLPSFRQLRDRLAERIERERIASLAIATY
jgi:TolB-like protein/tetratricopeptide (TPR) repeat protein